MRRLFHTFLLLLVLLPVSAQDVRWQPVSSWPFVYQQFQNAIIYTGPDNKMLRAQANIHVSNRMLWYDSYGKKLQAKEGIVNKVVFPDSIAYYNVKGRLCSVLAEDTVNGKLCRLYVAEMVDKPRYDELVRINRQSTMMIADIAPAFQDLASGVADNEGIRNVEQEPLPMLNKFYMLYNDELFEVNEGNILKHLGSREERNAYRAFTRKAEIMYGSKKSMLTVWSTFFVK